MKPEINVEVSSVVCGVCGGENFKIAVPAEAVSCGSCAKLKNGELMFLCVACRRVGCFPCATAAFRGDA